MNDLYEDITCDDLIASVPKRTTDTNILSARQTIQFSQDFAAESAAIELMTFLLEKNKYNRLVINSWDLANVEGVTGTKIRFDHTLYHYYTPDYSLTLKHYSKQDRLKHNAQLQRENLMASLALNHKHDSELVWGATADHLIQLMLYRLNKDIKGWLVIADQFFLEIKNKWQPMTQAQYPYLKLEQVVFNKFMTAEQAYAEQRRR